MDNTLREWDDYTFLVKCVKNLFIQIEQDFPINLLGTPDSTVKIYTGIAKSFYTDRRFFSVLYSFITLDNLFDNIDRQLNISIVGDTDIDINSALRMRARRSGKSLNEAAVDALTKGAGVAGSPRKRRDLDDIAGTWKADKAVEGALADQDRVDEDLWR